MFFCSYYFLLVTNFVKLYHTTEQKARCGSTLHLIPTGTLFTTINSSVDKSRKTLALFNKDWNTYKSKWQKGFNTNGFAGGVKSAFQSNNSVVSSDQIQMLRNWNNAVKHGCTNQETFNRIIANADDNTKMYFAGLNKGKGSLDGLRKAQNTTKKSTVGLTIAQTALNIAISMGLMAAISLAIKGFNKMINHAKLASEAADEAFEETSDRVEEQREELRTLDELISKYKELKKDGILDIEGRKEVKELQNDIADLVGTQARNLDLVNGKLDDEIKKLDEVAAIEAKEAYETSIANYNNAKRSNSSATGDDSYMFFDGYAYTGDREKRAEKVLKNNGFGNNVSVGGFLNDTLFITDEYDNDMNKLEGAQEKADYLQSMIDVLEQNGLRSTELYSGLITQRDKYLGYVDKQQSAANTLVSTWISYSRYYNDELSDIEVNSVESFEAYRQKMIELAKKDESIAEILMDGVFLSEDDLEKAINDFMATSTIFSTWYEQWINGVQDDAGNTNAMMVSLSALEKISDSIQPLRSAFEELSDDGYITIKTLDDIRTATDLSEEAWEEYQSKLISAEVGSEEFNQTLSDLTYKILTNKFAASELNEVTEEEIGAILRENGVIADSSLLLERLRLEKALLSKEEINTSSEAEQILNLANSANVSAASIKKLTRALEFLKKAEKSEAAGELRMAEYYRNQAQVYLGMPIKYDDLVKYTSTSSSKTNEVLDNYLKDAENRYKIHQDENKYIQELRYAYANLAKDEKERLGITDKINEAYRDRADNRIKDIEHEIDLAKELYGDDFDVSAYYDKIQDVAHEEANRLRAMGYDDNSNEIQSLQKTWWDAENSKLDFYIKQRESVIRDIEHARDMALKQNPNLDTTSYYRQMQDEYHRQAEYYRSIDAEKYKAKIQELQDAWWDAEEAIIENRKNAIEKSLSDIDDYIDARNHYNNWNDSKVSEVEAIKLQCELLDEAYRLNLISLEEYTEKSAQYTQKLYTVAKENIIETISELVEDYEEMRQFESSQLESQKTLLESYYDVSNAIVEARHEIDKELKASQSMHEYLNEDARELLFNQEDYNALNEELLEIQTAADELQKQYQKDILNANAETIAEITSQYQMQYETMMKQYEIAKAELEVAKKRQKLDNVLAERNTRMFINGQWQWVANTQNVIDAQNELADAEMEKQRQEASLEQTEAVNKLTERINAIGTDLNKVRKYWTDMQDLLNGNSEEFAKALREISRVSSPELKRIIEASGGDVKSFSESLSESTNTLAGIISTDLSNMSTGIDSLITDLQNYSTAIQLLIDQINGTTSSGRILKVGADGNAPSGATIGDTIVTAGGNYKIVPANTPGATYNPASGHWSVKVNNSSGNNSSNSSGSGKTVQVGSNGNAPAGTKVGDVVKTSGGDYLVVAPNTKGASYNPVSGLWSIKVKEKDADGTRYTSGGLTLMGEDGFEAFITNNGRFIPINQPTIGNVGAGGVVFNREQMANLRNLWDLSNLGKISPFVSSSNTNKQSTVIDNSIHINGLTVGEQGNEDWINGLRRYVATHK